MTTRIIGRSTERSAAEFPGRAAYGRFFSERWPAVPLRVFINGSKPSTRAKGGSLWLPLCCGGLAGVWWCYLSLPQIKSGYIDDAIHQGRALVGCVRLHAQGAQEESPLPAIGAFEQSCSNSRKTTANAAGAARRTQRHGRDIPGGWSRLGAPHSRSARANVVMSDDREYRGNEPAERTDCHNRHPGRGSGSSGGALSRRLV